MRFSTIVSFFALAVGLAAATPVVDRDSAVSLQNTGGTPSHTAVDTSHGVDTPSDGGSDATPSVDGKGGDTVSKREDHNPLDERAPALLVLCPRRSCQGRCLSYNLSFYQFNRCYFAQHPYYSLYISSHSGLHYGVYVGIHRGRLCKGVLVPRVRQ